MPHYDLRAIDGGTPVQLDRYEASDAREAIGLAAIRLECRDMVISCGKLIVAHITSDGRTTQ